MRQADIFLQSAGDAWLARNLASIGERDPVCDAIDHLGLKPERVLEVGCANGWRLRKMRERYGCEAYGIDPAKPGNDPRILRGWAHSYPEGLPFFDCIIFGHCLYLTDREDLFAIAAEADLHLRHGGHIIIHDFFESTPFARQYEHHDGVLSYHMDHAALWIAHPWYRKVDECSFPLLGEAVTVLRKDATNAFPVRT